MGFLLNSTSRDRQLSHFGEALLATTILLAGLVMYLGSWGISDRITSRGEICLRLPHDDLAASLKRGPVENQLLRQYLQGTRLIQALSAASPAQRVRLNEQLNGIVRELDSLCHLNMYYYNQGAALLTLATTSATVVVVCLLLVAPEGVQNITRVQRTMFFSSAAILGVSINLLQLGEQQVNASRAQTMYHSQKALLQRMASSLANQRLETGIFPAQSLEPLRNAEAVAWLISGIDNQRLAMPEPRFFLNDKMANDIWSSLLNGDKDRPPERSRTSPLPTP